MIEGLPITAARWPWTEEMAKVNRLLDHSKAWQKSKLIRDYLDALCFHVLNGAVVVPLDSQLADYLRWGFNQADRIDPLRPSPHSVLDDDVDISELADAVGDIPRKPR